MNLYRSIVTLYESKITGNVRLNELPLTEPLYTQKIIDSEKESSVLVNV